MISSQVKKPRFIVDEMPINSPTGFLDITNAALRTSNIITSNLHFRGSSNVFVTTHNEYEKTLEFTHPTTAFTTVGNVEVGGTLTMGNIAVEALHSLEAVTAVGNTTPLTVEFTNIDTSLVASGNVEVNGNVTFPGDVDITSKKTGVYGEVDSITRIVSSVNSGSTGTTGVVSDDDGNYYVTSRVSTSADILNADGTIHSSPTPGTANCAVIVSYNALGEVQWVNQVNTNSAINTSHLALHGDTLYVCGRFSTSATFIRNSDSTSYTRSASSASVLFIMRITASTGAIEGISTIYSSSVNDSISGITVDASGQVYVTGTAGAAPVTFTDYNGNVTSVSLASSNDRSAFMVKYTSSLTPEWVVQVDDLVSTTYEFGIGVDVDSNGNLYLCGHGYGTPTIRDTNGLSTVQPTSSFSSWGTFVIKFNSAGIAQKISTIDSSTIDNVNDIAIDSSDNIYVLYNLGKNTSTITDGDGITTSTVVAENSNTAAVVVKYDSELAAEWTAKVEIESSGGNVDPKHIAVDENGTVFICGGAYHNAAYKAIDSGGNVYAVGTPTGTYSGFVVSFDTNGTYVWGSCIDGPSSEYVHDITYSSGNVYVTGSTPATSGNLTITNGNRSVETVDITAAFVFTIRYNLKDAYALRVNNGAIVTGDLEVGTANLFVDTVTGRVGIGTSSPSSRLHVGDGSNPPAGTVDADASLTLDGAGQKKVEQSKPGIYHRENVGLGLHSDYKMSFEVGGSSTLVEAMRINNDGNVGVGLTTPDVKLHVNGSMTVVNLPRWRANFASTSGDILSTGTVIWPNVDGDNRSGYDTTTGLYTVQEAGHYFIYCHMYTDAGDSDCEIAFRINGSDAINDVGAAYSRAGESEGYTNLVLMSNLDLNVNDTIGVTVIMTGVHYNSRGVSYFGGYKVC